MRACVAMKRVECAAVKFFARRLLCPCMVGIPQLAYTGDYKKVDQVVAGVQLLSWSAMTWINSNKYKTPLI